MQVKFHNEEFPQGIEFDVGGLLFKNGEMTEVSKEEAEAYEAKTGVTLKEALSKNTLAEVDGVKFVPVKEEEEKEEEPTLVPQQLFNQATSENEGGET